MARVSGVKLVIVLLCCPFGDLSSNSPEFSSQYSLFTPLSTPLASKDPAEGEHPVKTNLTAIVADLISSRGGKLVNSPSNFYTWLMVIEFKRLPVSYAHNIG